MDRAHIIIRRGAGRAGVALLLLAVTGGCALFDRGSTSYRPPPLSYYDPGPAMERSPVVAVGRLGAPAHRTPLPDVGRELSEALRGTLANRRGLQVAVDPSLGRTVEEIVSGAGRGRAERFAELREAHPETRYVVIGRVTDFDHVDRDRGWKILASKREALVAIEFSVVDLHAERLVLTEHVHATAKADERDPADVYAGVSASSYRFWSTPLGRASGEAIREASKRIETVTAAAGSRTVRVPAPAWESLDRTTTRTSQADEGTPRRRPSSSSSYASGAFPPAGRTGETGSRLTGDLGVRILSVTGPRRVRLSAAGPELRDGDEYYVCRLDTRTARLEPLRDPQTRLPLRIRVERSTWGGTPGGWIVGRPDPEDSLRGAVLVSEMPAADDRTVGAALAREADGNASGF